MGRDCGAFIFHLLLVSTSCWTNSPLHELLVVWDTGTHMCRHCIEIIFRFRRLNSRHFSSIKSRSEFKRYTPLQWCHMGDIVSQIIVNSTLFSRIFSRLTKKTYQVIIGHLDSPRKRPVKRKSYPCHDVISNTLQGIWTDMVHSPKNEPRAF